MSDDWILSVTDVAEALGWTRDAVMSVIASGELPALPGRRIRVSHSELRAFVAHRQRGALELGVTTGFEPGFLASRPVTALDHNDGAR